MSDRHDYVTRAKRHLQSEWSHGAARMANGIEMEFIYNESANTGQTISRRKTPYTAHERALMNEGKYRGRGTQR